MSYIGTTVQAVTPEVLRNMSHRKEPEEEGLKSPKSAAMWKTLPFVKLMGGPEDVKKMTVDTNVILKMAFEMVNEECPGAISKEAFPGKHVFFRLFGVLPRRGRIDW